MFIFCLAPVCYINPCSLAATGAPLPAQHGARCSLAAGQEGRSCPRLGQRLCAASRGGGAGDGRQHGRISRTTEVSGTRPCTTSGAQAEGAAGPQRDDAPHRGHGEGLRGREARTGAYRSEGERGWSTVRKRIRRSPARMRRPG